MGNAVKLYANEKVNHVVMSNVCEEQWDSFFPPVNQANFAARNWFREVDE